MNLQTVRVRFAKAGINGNDDSYLCDAQWISAIAYDDVPSHVS